MIVDEVSRLPATLTVEEVRVLSGLSRRSVYEGLRRVDLPGTQIGRRWVVSRQRLKELLGVSDANVAAAILAAASTSDLLAEIARREKEAAAVKPQKAADNARA